MDNTNLFTEIDQDGIAKLSAAAQAEADFFRDYGSEPSLEELAAVIWAEAQDAEHQSAQAELAMYAQAGCDMREAAYMARLEGPVQ